MGPRGQDARKTEIRLFCPASLADVRIGLGEAVQGISVGGGITLDGRSVNDQGLSFQHGVKHRLVIASPSAVTGRIEVEFGAADINLRRRILFETVTGGNSPHRNFYRSAGA
jgi:hypothetical protein